MKKILFITGGSNSGSEHCLFSLIASLSREEAEVVVLARHNDYLVRHPLPSIHYYSEETYLSRRTWLQKLCERLHVKGPYFPFTFFFRHVLKASKPDLIYCNYLALPAVYNFFFDKGIPVLVHAHSLQQYLYGFPFALLEKRLKNAALVLSSSEVQKEALIQLVPGLKPLVLYPPVELSALVMDNNRQTIFRNKWNLPDKARVWAMAATYFNYNKDPDRFIEIGRRILSTSSEDVFFLWIGGSRESTAIRMALNKLKSLGLESKFIFTGDCSREDYIQWLGIADGLMLISIEESFSIVSVEALALGKPVVAFKSGGVLEILNTTNSCLVEPFSLDAMAGQVCKVNSEPEKYKDEELKESVRHFDISCISARWKDLILKKSNLVRGKE